MKNNSQDLYDILNDIVYGLKNVKIDGCVELSQIKRAYRSIFGKEYEEDENKEIIATTLNGRMKGLHPFLDERGCCWIDFIGCDSFSNKYKKQIFFATVSKNLDVYKKRKKFLSMYSKLVNKEIPVDIFVQLFFTDREQFLKKLKRNSDISKISKTLEKIQNDGFVIPLSKSFYEDSRKLKWDEKPLIIDVLGCRHSQNDSRSIYNQFYRTENSFGNAVQDLIQRKKSGLKLYDQMEIFLRKTSKCQDLPDLIKIVTIFNKSLYPKEVNLLYFIPSHCPDGAVGLFCYGAKRTLSEKELSEIKLLSYNILYPYVTSYKSAWENKQIVNESIKSAVSAIMSRNMSHNLGSHYLYYTKSFLLNLAQKQGMIGPDIRGVAKVLSYIQARMDYLATVISNDKYPYGAVNFKSQIYDELTVDDFSRRHFPEKRGDRTTNFLLTNLVLSENFSRPDVRDNPSDMPKGTNRLNVYVKYSDDGKSYEKFTGTGASLYDDNNIELFDKCDVETQLQIKNYGNFSNYPAIVKESELAIKNKLSSLNIALPGGTMSSHAFFNVIENFIRNSAKYLRNDFDKEKGLICTIAIRPHCVNGFTIDNKYIDLIIYDNKNNAGVKKIDNSISTPNEANDRIDSLFDYILDKLGNIKILDSQNQISKDNKGFKEMLFSSAWMKSFSFGKRTFADIISSINSEMSQEDKLKIIETYGFSLVKVVDEEFYTNGLKPNNPTKIDVYNREMPYDGSCSLGIMLKLPVFNTFQKITLDGDLKKDINTMLNMMADVIIVDSAFLNSQFKNVFTRPLCLTEEDARTLSDYEKIEKAIKKRFPEIDKYAIRFADKRDDSNIVIEEPSYQTLQDDSYKIYFMRHLNTEKVNNKYNNYACADSVSGGDFTVTLLDLFENGLDEKGYFKSERDKIFALKIKESALTRITIIDERLYKSSYGKFHWLSLSNIRVLNYSKIDEQVSKVVDCIIKKEDYSIELKSLYESLSHNHDDNIQKCIVAIDEVVKKKGVKDQVKKVLHILLSEITPILTHEYDLSNVFEGNSFRDNSNSTHFISIHLGLIEKILKNSIWINIEIDKRLNKNLDWIDGNRLDPDRVSMFMTMLKEHFGWTTNENCKSTENKSITSEIPKIELYSAIHSGRGNYSAELDLPLAKYPFISLSALENAFNNSKFLLSQLFYNTVYLGKGFANH